MIRFARRFARGALLCWWLVISCSTGCDTAVSQRLLGEWEGGPDTAAQQRSRWRLKSPDGEAAAVRQESRPAPVAVGLSNAQGTMLEQLADCRIQLQFSRNGRVQMQLEGTGAPLEGVWRVVQFVPPDGAELEIGLLQSDEAAGESVVDPQRRFLLQFERAADQQGQVAGTEGFTLREQGADSQFGQLYFQRRRK